MVKNKSKKSNHNNLIDLQQKGSESSHNTPQDVNVGNSNSSDIKSNSILEDNEKNAKDNVIPLELPQDVISETIKNHEVHPQADSSSSTPVASQKNATIPPIDNISQHQEHLEARLKQLTEENEELLLKLRALELQQSDEDAITETSFKVSANILKKKLEIIRDSQYKKENEKLHQQLEESLQKQMQLEGRLILLSKQLKDDELELEELRRSCEEKQASLNKVLLQEEENKNLIQALQMEIQSLQRSSVGYGHSPSPITLKATSIATVVHEKSKLKEDHHLSTPFTQMSNIQLTPIQTVPAQHNTSNFTFTPATATEIIATASKITADAAMDNNKTNASERLSETSSDVNPRNLNLISSTFHSSQPPQSPDSLFQEQIRHNNTEVSSSSIDNSMSNLPPSSVILLNDKNNNKNKNYESNSPSTNQLVEIMHEDNNKEGEESGDEDFIDVDPELHAKKVLENMKAFRRKSSTNSNAKQCNMNSYSFTTPRDNSSSSPSIMDIDNTEPYKPIRPYKRAVEGILSYLEKIPSGLFKDPLNSNENLDIANVINAKLCTILLDIFLDGLNLKIYWFSSFSIWEYVKEALLSASQASKPTDKINENLDITKKCLGLVDEVERRLGDVLEKRKLAQVSRYSKEVVELKFRWLIFLALSQKCFQGLMERLVEFERRDHFYYATGNLTKKQFREKLLLYSKVLAPFKFSLEIEDVLGKTGSSIDLTPVRLYMK